MIDLLKNKIKMIVLIFILMFVSSGIGVFATYNYLASEVKYTDDKSVADALNDLYSKVRISDSELVVNKNEYISSISFESSNNYKYYILTNVYWYSDKKAYADCLNNSNIKNITNATYISVGATGRNSSVASASTRSFIIFPDETGQTITITFTQGSDAACIYGIK